MNTKSKLDSNHLHTIDVADEYRGKTFVIKYGGAAMTETALCNSFAEDICFLKELGIQVVIVHGGGKEISDVSAKMNIPVRFVNGLRYTDEETMKVVQMVLAGKINKDITTRLNKLGAKALGISGIDADLLKVKKYTNGSQDLGYVGEITTVNSSFLDFLLRNDIIPVIAPVGLDETRRSYNINADSAASCIAASLKAERLIYLSDVKGIIVNRELITRLDMSQAAVLIEKNIINNGMIPKIKSAFHSLEAGVGKVQIIDGCAEHSLMNILCNKNINGTELVLSESSYSFKSNTHNLKI